MCSNAQYWCDNWADGRTGWKAFEESKPFQQNIDSMWEALGIKESRLSGCAFVPLCGDTHALRFLLDSGCSEVWGVDIVLESIHRNIRQNFADFELVSEKSLSNGIHFTLTNGKNKTAHFLVGDALVLPLEHMGRGSIDVIYDRASLVALLPELRRPYVDVLRLLLKSQGIVFLELVGRPRDQRENGPPFHITTSEVEHLYHVPVHHHLHVIREHHDEEMDSTAGRSPSFLFRTFVIVGAPPGVAA